MIQNEINARIAAFVKDLEGLFAREALAAVSAALGRGMTPTAAAAPTRGRAARPAKAGKRARPAAAKPAAAATKASPEASNIDTAVLDYVKANPGAGVEQMVKALKVPTVKLKARVANLVSAKSIRKTGKTRGTRYFPA